MQCTSQWIRGWLLELVGKEVVQAWVAVRVVPSVLSSSKLASSLRLVNEVPERSEQIPSKDIKL